jgi:hypothetical protein
MADFYQHARLPTLHHLSTPQYPLNRVFSEVKLVLTFKPEKLTIF